MSEHAPQEKSSPEGKKGKGFFREFLEHDVTYLAGSIIAGVASAEGLRNLLEKGSKGIDFLVEFFTGPFAGGGGGHAEHAAAPAH